MYDRIFWLDDNPSFLSFLPQVSRELDLQGLLGRTTFAYDFQMGEEIVGKSEFDLYILDGDFPSRLHDGRRHYISQFLQALRQGLNVRFFGEESRESNTFVRFFKQLLAGRRAVVFSLSDDAILPAHNLGLPYFAKGLEDKSDIVKTLEYSLRFRDGTRREGWECGGIEDFVKSYLIKPASAPPQSSPQS